MTSFVFLLTLVLGLVCCLSWALIDDDDPFAIFLGLASLLSFALYLFIVVF